MTEQKGFTLIEVLVTVIILAFGMLGAASIQLESKRVGFDASQRAIAAGLAQDLVERMRTNTGSLASYAAQNIGGGKVSEPGSRCIASCTGAQIASLDLWEFEQAVDGASSTRVDSSGLISVDGLADPNVCITVVGNDVTIAIAWRGSVAISNPTLSACGAGSGKYGASDEFRQVFSISTFIEG
jgi:type IV pilus assembly protein PilV